MLRSGRRNTHQRDRIVEAFFQAGGHVTLQQLLDRVPDEGIGFATVYRTMKMLVEAGVAHERRFGDSDQTLYELADMDEHHDHVICVRCGRIEEFEDEIIERRQHEVAAALDWQVTHHRHEIYGICPQCRA